MFRSIFLHSLVKYISLFLYCIAIVISYNIIRNEWASCLYYCNSFFIAGFSTICFGGLSIVTHYGGFDLFSYCFARRDSSGKKPSYYDYMQIKKEKRQQKKYYFVPYFCVGGLFILIAICLLCVL